MKSYDVYDRVIAIIVLISLLRDPSKKGRDRTWLKRIQRKSETDTTSQGERTFDVYVERLVNVATRRVNHANAQNRSLGLRVDLSYSMTDEHDSVDKRLMSDYEQIHNAFILTGARTDAYTGKSVSVSATNDIYTIDVESLIVTYDNDSEGISASFVLLIEYVDTNPQNT